MLSRAHQKQVTEMKNRELVSFHNILQFTVKFGNAGPVEQEKISFVAQEIRYRGLISKGVQISGKLINPR